MDVAGPRPGGSLPCGRYLLAPLTGNKQGSKGLMILRVKPTPTRVLDQQSLYPDGQHILVFYIKCAPPVGLAAVIVVDRQLVNVFVMPSGPVLPTLCATRTSKLTKALLPLDQFGRIPHPR